MATYLKREISEWNTSDLSRWLIDNKYPGISELCQNNSLSGYDLFYITDDILKNELGLNSFHERKVTMKLIKKLIYEHLKLNIINSNGDNVILTLDNNPNTSLGELSEYIGGMFNINPKDILYKDTSKTEVLSPSLKIVELLILYPRLYKTLNVFNMKDYHQSSDNENNNEVNENMESKENDYNVNLINNNNISTREGRNSINDSEYQKSNIISNANKNRNIKMNFDYKLDKNEIDNNNMNMNNIKNDMNNMKNKKEKYSMEDMNDNKNMMIYKEDRNMKNNKEIIYNDDYDMRNKEELKYYRRDKNLNEKNRRNNENLDENFNEENLEVNNKVKYKSRDNYIEDEEYMRANSNNKGYTSYRTRKNMNFNCLGAKPYEDNYNRQYKNYEKNENSYENSMY